MSEGFDDDYIPPGALPGAMQLEDEFPRDACTLTRLKLSNQHFCNLAERYHALNRSIHRIEIETERALPEYLERLKAQRLRLLDEIAAIIEEAELHYGEEEPGETPAPPAAHLFGWGKTIPA